MNNNHIEGLPTFSYVVFYIDHNQIIAGYPQIAFRTVRATSPERVIEFMTSVGIKEENIQSIDQKV